MGKVKIKRKSTLIDMTAMSDVTVLLLTFFMLTSTFLQKEPTTVHTPSSVSEDVVPNKNLVTILVSGAEGNKADAFATEGKIYLSFTGDSIFPTETFRKDVLKSAYAIYCDQNHKKGTLTDQQIDAFAKTNMMGTSFKVLPEVLSLDMVERDKVMSDLTNPASGIPINTEMNENKLNDFQIWMKAIRQVAQKAKETYLDKSGYNREDTSKENVEKIRAIEMLANSLASGEAITIKADKDTPFQIINVIFENLRFMELNKFTLMTALKERDR